MKWRNGTIYLLALGLLFGCSKQDKVETVEVKGVAEVEVIPTIEKALPPENSKERTEDITHLMIHFTSNAAVNPKDPYNLDDVYFIFKEYGLSVHYIIDRDGQIFNLVPENRVAYHAGKGSLPNLPGYENKLNEFSIGIELLAIGTKEEMLSMIPEDTYNEIDTSLTGYTDAQYESLHRLITNIIQRNPTIKNDRQHIIGHDEYAPGRKTDPGSLFDWKRIGY
ncbi:N-acetylmuramoyl-L-alanine amidase [Bacillus sinesaloumensis]|uniref:N-acetylmuramoyl-L-alanine amidase n=1 Tax=Litchfieldia sinesaloumensis TaxID=1926280 RepID=UPI0009886DBB|nr:N-acetylmuramoyl-L-alanine amidase [Bacillus sinesaloumensis]